MQLLYLDDPGSTANPREQHLLLGGLSVFEAQSHLTGSPRNWTG